MIHLVKVNRKIPMAKARLVRPRAFIAPRGWEEPFDVYRSRFGFMWWFWRPRIHVQAPDDHHPRVLRLIWLCFAVNLDIWGAESRQCWPMINHD